MTMIRHRSVLLLLLWVVSGGAVLAQFPSAPPEEVGMSLERLRRLDGFVQEYIMSGGAVGAVSLVVRDGMLAHVQAYGMMDREQRTPMRSDAIFRIASMTKAVTSVAVMMLHEEGRFRLDDPVADFIPEFKDPVVAVASPAGSARTTRTVTEPAKRPITIRHLLTHTAGMSYGSGPAQDAYQEAGLTGFHIAGRDQTIGEVVRRLAKLPLNAHPGDAYVYGYATDVLGYLIEVVSGKSLDVFFQERIFDPLRMRDTHFFLPPDKAGRLAPLYAWRDTTLILAEPTATTDYIHGPRKCFSGGAGLLSTITDYGRFVQMLLNGGHLDDVRLLSRKSVELMTADHIGSLYNGGRSGYGLGFELNTDLGKWGALGSPGAYRGAGTYYTAYWIDPAEGLVFILMTQLMPARDLALRERFSDLVYQAIID